MDKSPVNMSDTTGLTATVSLDDGWIRLRPADRLDRETFDALAAATGLRWKRAEACLAGPWSPQAEDTLAALGVTLEEENVDLRLVAEARAAHYATWADDAAEAAEMAQAAGRDVLDRIPMGQPILVGHHSEARHRRDLARADNLMRRAYEESHRAEKWDGRAEATVRHAERRYSPRQLTSRIGMLEVARRRHERAEVELLRELVFSPLNREADNQLTVERRQIAFLERRIDYARQLLEEAEAYAAGDVSQSVAARLALPVEVGGAVSTHAPGGDTAIWYEVRRVNDKTLTVCGWPHVPQLTQKIKRVDVRQTMTAAEWAGAWRAVYGPGMRILGRGPEEGEG